jgi:hypothetical protein
MPDTAVSAELDPRLHEPLLELSLRPTRPGMIGLSPLQAVHRDGKLLGQRALPDLQQHTSRAQTAGGAWTVLTPWAAAAPVLALAGQTQPGGAAPAAVAAQSAGRSATAAAAAG